MSDEPLFQNTDAQEAAYDPKGTGALDEGGGTDRTAEPSDVIVPAGAVAVSGGNVGGTAGTSAGPAAPGIAPAAGAVALGEKTGEEERREDR